MGGLDGVRRGRVHYTFDTFGKMISPIFTPGWPRTLENRENRGNGEKIPCREKSWNLKFC